MPIPVSLKEVVDEVDGPGSAMDGWINRKSGELVFFPKQENYGSLDEFQAEIDRVEESDDFVGLLDRFDFHEYRVMERFSLTQSDDGVRERLLDAIRGKGAFRRFKDSVDRLGVRDQWFAYRNVELASQVADFLHVNGIPYIDDVGLPKRADAEDDDDD